jgi:hypothetical protein
VREDAVVDVVEDAVEHQEWGLVRVPDMDRVGIPLGRSNYCTSEVYHMFKSIRELLPISGLEWNLVADRHATFHPIRECTSYKGPIEQND